jgi:hypothetical protein
VCEALLFTSYFLPYCYVAILSIFAAALAVAAATFALAAATFLQLSSAWLLE